METGTSDSVTRIDLVPRDSSAGSVLGARRQALKNQPRPYTGMIAGRRRRKFCLLQLPGGFIGELLGAIRGRVFFRWSDYSQIDPIQLGSAPESAVRIFPLPAAQALGKLKAGVRERPSARKAQSCRRNGNDAVSTRQTPWTTCQGRWRHRVAHRRIEPAGRWRHRLNGE